MEEKGKQTTQASNMDSVIRIPPSKLFAQTWAIFLSAYERLGPEAFCYYWPSKEQLPEQKPAAIARNVQ